ncbi:hypothetical protein PCANC_26805 [Puccinia coronata f. sp. avenae]|uniref:BZIP domain-containing protein n=1 Tax=Puccinia coronata f. sp. avenae TaxID=200324 RepID=A0A2N5RY26_9BASI|nr:hypothetical protein PCANC_26805 [Puccinia coronata f. sp. avenae]
MTSLHEYPASPFPLAKRKTSEAYPSPKPTKLAKPLPSNLAFDPFNPHPGMSKEERKMARMIRNRTAAQASRDRKKEHVAELESRVRELEEQLKLLSDSFPATAPACLRPCCQQATASAALQPSRKPSVVTRAIQTDDQIRCPPHSLSDSIDPSIIQSNPLPPQPQPLLPPTLSKPNIPGKDSLSLDPQLKNEHPIDTQQPISIQPTNATISPTQAEYLSRVRIHVLEEENIQLKNQLEYELKKSHQFKCQLLRNQLTHPPTSVPNQQQLTTDKHHTDQEGLIEMMLEDEEIEHLLLASSKNPSASPPTTKLEQDSYTHSVDLAQLSLDWDSLLLDREGSCSTVSPVAPRATSSLLSGHHNQEQDSFGTEWKISSGTQGSSDTDDWPMMMVMVDDDNGRGSSRASSSSVLGGIEPSQPETPPRDLQPQAPAADAARALPGESSSSACSSSPAITQSGVFSHPRLVAREVDHPRVSLQRNGGEKSTRRGCYMRWSAATTYGPVVSHRAAVLPHFWGALDARDPSSLGDDDSLLVGRVLGGLGDSLKPLECSGTPRPDEPCFGAAPSSPAGSSLPHHHHHHDHHSALFGDNSTGKEWGFFGFPFILDDEKDLSPSPLVASSSDATPASDLLSDSLLQPSSSSSSDPGSSSSHPLAHPNRRGLTPLADLTLFDPEFEGLDRNHLYLA